MSKLITIKIQQNKSTKRKIEANNCKKVQA